MQNPLVSLCTTAPLPGLALGLMLSFWAPGSAAMEPLPDGQVVSGTNHISKAWLADPTNRYPHGALGDTIEAGAIVVETHQGSQLSFELGAGSVFEDLTPRLVDLDGDGLDEVVLIRAYAHKGAAISIFKVSVFNTQMSAFLQVL